MGCPVYPLFYAPALCVSITGDTLPRNKAGELNEGGYF
jgi:hypothetical protein